MAKGVKKIKWTGNGSVLEDYTSTANNIICVKPNQMVSFVVSEWYDDTTATEKEKTIIWLWQNQKKTTIFNRAAKQANTPFGVNIPKKLCGSYAYYLEASLYGAHDHRNTGVHVYGKCEEKITAASWSKKENTADTSEINYGNNLFITLETEGVNGDTLTLELYSEKNTVNAQTIKAKCIDGKILKAKFSTLGYNFFVPGALEKIEKFYIKVVDITGKYLINASGNDKILSITIIDKNAVPDFQIPTNNTPYRIGAPDKAPEDVKKEEESSKEGCGIEYRDSVSCTKYGQQYGPVYWGSLKLAAYSDWEILLSASKITSEEKSIIIGMSENEGKLDSIQSYDSEIVTVGAMQKTINPEGYGEFPVQIAEFKTEYPDKFNTLFKNCGWTVKKENDKWRAYYLDITGLDLKNKIRTGFDASQFGKKVQCIPIESLINASKDPYFQSKQIEDFIERLHLALDEIIVKKYHLNNDRVRVPDEYYSFKAKDILKSKLGKATLLDQHINRPALTKFDLGSSMNKFFEKNPNISKTPSEWGAKHSEYEVIILEDYGATRGGTDMKKRYIKMKDNSNLK
jgi:hypothetical protein